MTPYYADEWVTLYLGDCRDVLPELDPVSAVVTDPPYGYGFMGQGWDKALPDPEIWHLLRETCRPGAHLASFGAPRMYHRLAVSIEDQGWAIRDCLMWLYGTGFPKSLNVSKAIDAKAGAERERWEGWGTALKPAWEPILLARKALDGTVAANVLAHGTGGINVDGCRIPTEENRARFNKPREDATSYAIQRSAALVDPGGVGRWPANLVLDGEAAAMLDAQTGERVSGSRKAGTYGLMGYMGADAAQMPEVNGDRGGASRFFYCAKASRAERERGLEALPVEHVDPSRADGSAGRQSPRAGAGRNGKRRNTHPTVKPVALMRWILRLVSPPGGLVVDPFAGSGSTGIAAKLEGHRCVLIEREERYAEIAARRLDGWAEHEGGDER